MKLCCCCYLPHVLILAAAWIFINKQTNKQTKHKAELLINRPEIFKSGPTWICSMHICSVIPESWIPKTDSINVNSQFNAWPVVSYSSSWVTPLGMDLCRPHTLKYHMERERERERDSLTPSGSGFRFRIQHSWFRFQKQKQQNWDLPSPVSIWIGVGSCTWSCQWDIPNEWKQNVGWQILLPSSSP